MKIWNLAWVMLWPGRGRRIIIYDTFEAHVTEGVKASLAKDNTNLVLIKFSSN